jgi:hypothetical protein
MLVDQKKLDLYVAKGFNVLFEGERGVGKTSIIHETFKKAGLKVKYFSAPTMDPWTDLVGIPNSVIRADGKEVIRLIPPEDFADDKYDVIFIDELNRAPKKVMNALMELIQFKTINGKPYNIKMIWAAINPHNENEDYHVERLDPALEDRFQIKIKFPYKVDLPFFKQHHGKAGEIFCQWWNNQPDEVKKQISPRRLFDAVSFHMDGGDFRDMITEGNTQKLFEELNTFSQLEVLIKDLKSNNISQASKVLLGKNYSNTLEDYLVNNIKIFNFFIEFIDKDWISKQFLTKGKVFEYLMEIAKTGEEDKKNLASEIIKSIVGVKSETGTKKLNKFVLQNMDVLEKFLDKEFIEKHEKNKKNISENLLKAGVVAVGHWYSKEEKDAVNKIVFDNKFMHYPYYANNSTTLAQEFTLSKMSNICRGFKRNEKIDITMMKNHLAIRIGLVFAIMLKAREGDFNKLNGIEKKVFTNFTDETSVSYIWDKNVINKDILQNLIGKEINAQKPFSDLGVMILSVANYFKDKTIKEIQEIHKEIKKSPYVLSNNISISNSNSVEKNIESSPPVVTFDRVKKNSGSAKMGFVDPDKEDDLNSVDEVTSPAIWGQGRQKMSKKP